LPAYLEAACPGKLEVKEFLVWATTICGNGDKPWKTNTDEGAVPLYDQAIAYAPDYIIIVGGANDSKPVNWDNGCPKAPCCSTHFESNLASLYADFNSMSTVFAS
jgi:hypothetical protein